MEDFTFENPSTKSYLSMLISLGEQDSKTILVLPDVNKNVFLSSRNLEKTKVVLASELNTYEILNANKMLLMESSIKEIEKKF